MGQAVPLPIGDGIIALISWTVKAGSRHETTKLLPKHDNSPVTKLSWIGSETQELDTVYTVYV